MSVNNIPYMMTIKELSDKTGCSYYYIRQLIADSKIKFIKCGKKFLVNVDDFSDFLNNEERGCNG